MLSIAFATKSFSFVSAGVARVAANGIAAVSSLARALIHRREILRLAELDERSLKDIGLVRSDVDGALATSWLKDPSTILSERSRSLTSVAAARREEGLRKALNNAAVGQPRRVPANADNSVARCA
jgi:uncharacterized protein YjiS (DUF1127 family)